MFRAITAYYFRWTLIISYMRMFSNPFIIYSNCNFLLGKLSIYTIIIAKVVFNISKARYRIIDLTITSMNFGITFLSVIYNFTRGKDIYVL